MRVHISLDEDVVREIDRSAGARGRSAYIERAVLKALDTDARWERIWSAVGSIPDQGHDWDVDPGAWVRAQRAGDPPPIRLMGAVLLDSTVVIDLLRRRPGAIERLRAVQATEDTPFVCAVTVEEVTRGVRPSEEDDVVGLLTALSIAPLGVPEGRLAGFWRRSAAKRGRTLHQADCLIAAAAVGVGARVATGNPKDFPMRGVQVEHWPVGA